MTILARENDIYPENLFEMAEASPADRQWWALYTRSRREKALMRKLLGLSIPHYGVISPRRFKTPKGRVYTSYEPLFSNYVFLFGDDGERQTALKTNCISRCVPVGNGPELQRDLRQLRELIDMEVPLRPESRLEAGRLVQIRAGKFRGFRGTIIRRENEIRLLVAVKFLQQGASMLLEDFEVDALD